MDANRFDRVAKAMANWSSRRRFLMNLAGVTAGGAASHSLTARAQGGPNSEDLEFIAKQSACLETELLELQSSLSSVPFNVTAFDPRIADFIGNLLTLAGRGKDAAGWDQARLDDYLNTIALIPGAVSAGTDTDVYLYEYALAHPWESRPPATPQSSNTCKPEPPVATPPAYGVCTPVDAPTTPAEECVPSTGERPQTCAASCLDVWNCRQQAALAANDAQALTDAFSRFVECFLYWKSADTANVCLAKLVDLGCVLQIGCACTGDCH